jgi:hypothetical protein
MAPSIATATPHPRAISNHPHHSKSEGPIGIGARIVVLLKQKRPEGFRALWLWWCVNRRTMRG